MTIIHVVSLARLCRGPGLYVIQNVREGKRYVGQGVDVGRRAAEHWAKLRRGEHELPALQADWNRLGESAFSLQFYAVPVADLDNAELQLIRCMQSLEHECGYNKMMSRFRWGPEARIRNSEDKLVRTKKFCRLQSVSRELPMVRVYVETYNFSVNGFRRSS